MEVLSLQLGHFANHVGAHFWNFQDETAALQGDAPDFRGGPRIDFERLYSQTERRGVVRWTPRLVLVDKKGALGAARPEIGDEPSEEQGLAESGLWDYGSIRCPADVLSLHPFQQDLQREECETHKAASSQQAFAMDADIEEVAYDYDGMEDDRQGDDTERVSPMRTAAEYDFRSTARTFTDYLKIPLPSSCVHELRAWHHDVSPFATYWDGLEVRGKEDEEDILETIRKQFEICDQLDAVHTVFNMHDGFGGLAGIVLNWVHEESPKCGKLVAAVQPEVEEDVDGSAQSMENDLLGGAASVGVGDPEACSWVSGAFSFAGIMNASVDAFIPLAVPLWSVHTPAALTNLHRTSFYESSALIASALESATLPYRLAGNLRPSLLLAELAPAHRPVCGLLQALPLPPPPPAAPVFDPADVSASKQMLSSLGPSFYDLSAMSPVLTNPFTSLVLRGSEPRHLVELCQELHPRARRFSYVHSAPLPLPLPFPQVFSAEVSRHGLLQQGPGAGRPPGSDVEECPVATQLHAAAQAGRCTALQRMASTVRSRRRSAWASALQARHDVDPDEFRDVLEILTEHLECGAAGSEGGSDASDDM